jgi:hypothetical protein
MVRTTFCRARDGYRRSLAPHPSMSKRTCKLWSVKLIDIYEWGSIRSTYCVNGDRRHVVVWRGSYRKLIDVEQNDIDGVQCAPRTRPLVGGEPTEMPISLTILVLSRPRHLNGDGIG